MNVGALPDLGFSEVKYEARKLARMRADIQRQEDGVKQAEGAFASFEQVLTSLAHSFDQYLAR